jgi:hypothetical protein
MNGGRYLPAFKLNAVNAVFSGFELNVHRQPSDVFCPVNNLIISRIDRV